jgi:hypothetical protein
MVKFHGIYYYLDSRQGTLSIQHNIVHPGIRTAEYQRFKLKLKIIFMECPGLEQSRKRLPDRSDITPGQHLDSRSALGYIDNWWNTFTTPFTMKDEE